MNALYIVHEIVKKYTPQGGVAVDATAGRGYDTAFLCDVVGKEGKVYAFDIQESAINSTKALLDSQGKSAELILDSHANMDKYITEDVDVVMFNLGYLPHGDHSIYTHYESTKEAIMKGLDLLKSGGVMCVSIYYGGDSGYEEKDALLPWLKTLDDNKYQVLATFFHNWKGDPPIPVVILKH